MSTSTQLPVSTTPPRPFHFKYTVLPGYFLQSEETTNDIDFDFRTHNFGLITRTYPTDTFGSETPHWKRFATHIRTKAAHVPSNSFIKVLFLGRHGQGWHNVAETKYGTEAWDHYYSALPSLDGSNWTDAELTPLGQQQARDVHLLWASQLRNGIPLPDTYYVSPLSRTIETADLSFADLDLPADKPYRPLIKELLREVMGVHTCDQRSTKSHIAQKFPHVVFEPGFAEADELWDAAYREPRGARRYRLASLLDDIFANDGNLFLSLTAHSGAIASILEVVGHRPFALETGGVIPVVVLAERVDGVREVPEKEPSDGPSVMWTEVEALERLRE